MNTMRSSRGLELCQGKFRLDIRNNFLTERPVKLQSSEGVTSMAVFKRHVYVVLRDMA